MTESVRTILSGPAGGAVGAFEIGKMAGHDRMITFDMGGTSHRRGAHRRMRCR